MYVAPSEIARGMSARSRAVSAGDDSRAAGTATPLPERTVPPRMTSVRMLRIDPGDTKLSNAIGEEDGVADLHVRGHPPVGNTRP